MVLYLARSAASAVDTVHRTNCRKLFRLTCYTQIIALCAAPPAADTDDNAENIRAILANGNNCANWIIDLINAAKKKDLETGNVEGYFASLGNKSVKSGAIVHMINSISPFFPDYLVTSTTDMMAELTPGIWTVYRTTRVSAGNIIFKLRDDFIRLGIFASGDAVDTAITACKDNAWNIVLSLDIPNRVKAYAAIYLDVAGIGIDKWYQGNKAIDELPASKVKASRVIFKKYLELTTNTEAVTAATDTAAMVTAIPTGFWD